MYVLSLFSKQMDKICQESNLEKLSAKLNKIGSPYSVAVQYLRTLKNLYHLMVSKKLASNWKRVINDFRHYFDICYDLKLVNMTPKVHMLYDHLWQWCHETGETLFFADTSGKCPKSDIAFHQISNLSFQAFEILSLVQAQSLFTLP